MCIVRIVEYHLERMLVVDVHAARRLKERAVESSQSMAYGIELDVERKRERRGEHRILHVVHRARFERRRDQVRPHQRDMTALVVQRDHMAVDPGLESTGSTASTDMLAHDRVLRIQG